MSVILGGVGLGICSACRAPGAFWYQPVIDGWDGVWMCDSCQWPGTVAARIYTHRTLVREQILRAAGTPKARFT